MSAGLLHLHLYPHHHFKVSIAKRGKIVGGGSVLLRSGHLAATLLSAAQVPVAASADSSCKVSVVCVRIIMPSSSKSSMPTTCPF